MSLTPEYRIKLRDLYASAAIKPVWLSRVIAEADKAGRHIAQYVDVERLTGVPWHVVAIIHARESDASFKRHLHNGDPLKNERGEGLATVQVPSGRGPFEDWLSSAVDAIELKLKDWRGVFVDTSDTLYFLQRNNGFGYASKGVNSPYLWSGTQHYENGLFVRDGEFDPHGVDRQPGCAALLKEFVVRGWAYPWGLAELRIAQKARPGLINWSRAPELASKTIQASLNQLIAIDNAPVEPLKMDGDIGPRTRTVYRRFFGRDLHRG